MCSSSTDVVRNRNIRYSWQSSTHIYPLFGRFLAGSEQCTPCSVQTEPSISFLNSASNLVNSYIIRTTIRISVLVGKPRSPKKVARRCCTQGKDDRYDRSDACRSQTGILLHRHQSYCGSRNLLSSVPSSLHQQNCLRNYNGRRSKCRCRCTSSCSESLIETVLRSLGRLLRRSSRRAL